MTDSAPPAIAGVETFVVHPDGLGAGLRISIARPSSRWGGDAPAGPLSVVFLTDADYAFGTVVEASRLGQFGADHGPTIVVGIGYAEERGDYAFVEQRRSVDFYRGPRRSLEVPGLGTLELGGADAFLAALLDTVVSEVARRAPETVGARRILIGMSAGGHFAAHVLTQRPDAFQGYALLSPALVDFPPAPGDEQLVEAVRALPSGSIPPGTVVFLSAGADEEDPGGPLAVCSIISNAYRMRTALSAHGVAVELTVFPDESHNSSLGVAATRALRFLVPPAN
ncbi:alpha/beta hydrolase [Nocardioides panzhihuensis]|uniref:Putative alpha/beta superfamily hydrolase n=1 Tax=Nocardioides panzhihuensis TaxID=860243 RepID=A0A7Z0IS46_9ACTN|nr:alpha/beta hydrolase-fold protein [Nocardioides panzhihuensis]NYI77674.1 putative alpha/beta superfamily hydrolase [Nocardioides panzhihuensis]